MTQYIVGPEDCSEHDIFPGVKIRTTAGERMMLSLVEFEADAVVELHQHPHEQMGMLLEGELEFTIEGQVFTVLPGQMWRIPGGVEHSVIARGKAARALDVFSPIREDYL